MSERKKKLLVILGAGSSLAQDMPSVAEDRPSAMADRPAIPPLNSSMKTWSREWSAHHQLPNYFEAVWNAVDQYYHSSTRTMNPAHQPRVNYEKVLGEMLGLAHWMEPPPFGNAFRQIASANAAPPELIFPFFDEEHRYGATVAVTDQLTYLLRRLAGDMRERCQRIDITTPAFQAYKKLVGGLCCAFDVGIYNLNYDNVALRAWPQAFTGFASAGAFNPGTVHERAEWDFVYHLHGSVHHTLERESGSSIHWQPDLGAHFFDGHPGLATDRRSEGKAFPTSTLIAGGCKLDQLLVEPFQSLYATLVRHAYEADAVLIGGYGFSDPHINRALQNRMKGAAARCEPRPPLMILDWFSDKNPHVIRDDIWGSEMCNTLAIGEWFFHNSANSEMTLRSERMRRDFRINSTHRAAFWPGGFIEAADHLDLIVPWLEGEADG